MLCAHGVDVDARDERRQTALMRAARAGHLRVVKVLLAQGADTGATDAERRSAVDHAQDGGYEEVVDVLRMHAPID